MSIKKRLESASSCVYVSLCILLPPSHTISLPLSLSLSLSLMNSLLGQEGRYIFRFFLCTPNSLVIQPVGYYTHTHTSLRVAPTVTEGSSKYEASTAPSVMVILLVNHPKPFLWPRPLRPLEHKWQH